MAICICWWKGDEELKKNEWKDGSFLQFRLLFLKSISNPFPRQSFFFLICGLHAIEQIEVQGIEG